MPQLAVSQRFPLYQRDISLLLLLKAFLPTLQTFFFFWLMGFHFANSRNVASPFRGGGLQVCLQAIVKIESERKKQVNYMFLCTSSAVASTHFLGSLNAFHFLDTWPCLQSHTADLSSGILLEYIDVQTHRWRRVKIGWITQSICFKFSIPPTTYLQQLILLKIQVSPQNLHSSERNISPKTGFATSNRPLYGWFVPTNSSVLYHPSLTCVLYTNCGNTVWANESQTVDSASPVGLVVLTSNILHPVVNASEVPLPALHDLHFFQHHSVIILLMPVPHYDSCTFISRRPFGWAQSE